MNTFQKTLVATLLTLSLLVAPAAIASPDAAVNATWMQWIEDFVVDLYDALNLEPSTASTSKAGQASTADSPTFSLETEPIDPNSQTTSQLEDGGDGSGGEIGPVIQPNG